MALVVKLEKDVNIISLTDDELLILKRICGACPHAQRPTGDIYLGAKAADPHCEQDSFYYEPIRLVRAEPF